MLNQILTVASRELLDGWRDRRGMLSAALYSLMGPGVVYLNEGPFQLAEIWWTFFWWVVGLNVLQLAWRTTDLVRGTWRHPQTLQRIIFKGFGLIPIVILLSASHASYVLLRHSAADQVRYSRTLETINKSVHLGLLVICAIASLQLAWDIGQALLLAQRQRSVRE